MVLPPTIIRQRLTGTHGIDSQDKFDRKIGDEAALVPRVVSVLASAHLGRRDNPRSPDLPHPLVVGVPQV
jgi:hypothetical protein